MILAFLLLGLVLAFALSGGDDAIEVDEPIEGTDEGDEIDAGGGNDLVHGNGGDDILRGGAGDDTLDGGTGNDFLTGDRGNDLLDGGSGNDTLETWSGTDTLLGGEDDDTLLIASPDGTLADGGAGDDLLIWQDGEATLEGGAGDDTISLSAADHPGALRDGSIDGGAGHDLLRAGGFANHLTLRFSGDGSGTLTDGNGTVAFDGIEAIHLANGRHLIDASATTSGLDLRVDESTYYDPGATTILGGAGNDTLAGGNTMTGGAGDDLIIAGPSGTLTGGEGADSFVDEYYAANGAAGEQQHDGTVVITDFEPGTDTIALTVSYASEYSVGGDPPVTADPPIISIVEDLAQNETRVLVGGRVALILSGVTGLDPAALDIELVVG